MRTERCALLSQAEESDSTLWYITRKYGEQEIVRVSEWVGNWQNRFRRQSHAREGMNKIEGIH
jgi:hypothetical protein